jgi:hypothetical protein
MMKRAQASMDLLIVLGVMLVVFAILFQTIVLDRIVERVETEVLLDARTQAEKVAMAVNEVYLGGENTNKSFYLPDKLAHSKEYNLTVYDSGTVICETMGKRESVPILTSKLTTTTLNASFNVIENSAGGIIFG